MSTRQVLAVFSLLAVCAFSGCDDETVVVGVDCIANACDASNASVIKKCVQGQFKEEKCADGAVCVASEDATKGAMCQPKQSDPADKCEPEQTKCKGDKIATCGADKAWGESKACEKPGEVCILNADGKAACQPKQSDPADKCEPEQTKCDGDKIATCGADEKWGESKACEKPGEVCILNAEGKAACQPKQPDPDGKCVPDKTKCEGDKIATCGADEKWGVAVECEGENQVCQTIDGIDKCAPKPECVAQQTKCDGELIVNCSESGMWGEAEPCPHGQTCKKDGDDEKCAEKDKECEAGQIKCFESGSSLPTNLYYACDGQYWAAAPTSCEDGKICQVDNGVAECKAATGPIEICTKDAILCVDPDKTADYKKCVDTTGGGTHWSETTEQCADNQLCFSIEGTDKCAKCKPGTSKCDGTLNGFQECSNGGAAWGRVKECNGKDLPICAEVSSGVAKCVACENGKMRCNHMTKTPKVEKCVDHEWKQHESCGGKVCLDGTETQPPKCVDCEGDQKKCNGTVIQTCDNNTWKDGKDCSTEGKVCDHSTFECVDKCNDGDAKCDDSGAFFICKSNTWVKKTDCGAKDKCVDKVSTPDKMNLGCKCANNAELCDANNDNVLICKEMKEGSVVYMSLDVFKECAKGMCANAIESVPGKPSMAYCKCNDGDFECKDSSNYRYCKDGKWNDGVCGGKSETCDADLRTCNTQCGPLVQDAGSCSGWNRLTCKDSKDGKLVFAEACTNGCQYRTNNAVTPVVPKDLTPRIASGDRGRCIEKAVAGTKRCSKDLRAVESYSLSEGGHSTGKWFSQACGKGQVCMWKRSSDLSFPKASETPQCVALECREGTYKCSDKEKPGIMQCINNKWELIGNCAAGLTCQSTTISYRPLTCS